MHVEKSISINASAEKIKSVLVDFNQWRAWSPWLIMEPEAVVTVNPDGKSYSWEGNRVGSGEMVTTSSEGNDKILYDLTFLKPWKSKAKVGFDLVESGESTEVKWWMDSSMPFFLFFMTKMMEAFVGMDYYRGLLMLKDYIEAENVPSTLEYEGKKAFEGTKYVGLKTACKFANIDTEMERDFNNLAKLCEEKSIPMESYAFTIYNKMDVVKGDMEYTVAMPIGKDVEGLPDGFFIGEAPRLNSAVIKHTGPYRHVGNAWAQGYMMDRNKEFKINKKAAAIEVYLNDPDKVPENELVTEVYLPLK